MTKPVVAGTDDDDRTLWDRAVFGGVSAFFAARVVGEAELAAAAEVAAFAALFAGLLLTGRVGRQLVDRGHNRLVLASFTVWFLGLVISILQIDDDRRSAVVTSLLVAILLASYASFLAYVRRRELRDWLRSAAARRASIALAAGWGTWLLTHTVLGFEWRGFAWLAIGVSVGVWLIAWCLRPTHPEILDEEAARQLLGARARKDDREILRILNSQSKSRDPALLKYVLLVLTGFRSFEPATLEWIASQGAHRDPDVRRGVAHVLARSSDAGSVPALLQLLADTDLGTREWAAMALAKRKGAAAVDQLLDAWARDQATEDSSLFRKSIVEALSYGDPDAIDALERIAREDRRWSVRRAAMRARRRVARSQAT